MQSTIKAAGTTIMELTRNLSRMAHSWVRVAAMVVSDIKERLSPKREPPTTRATIMGRVMPVFSARPTATGVRATMVPTLVPTEREMKQAARKMPASSSCSGTMSRVRLTVASMAPMVLAPWAKAPARMKIQTMRSMFLFDAPWEKQLSRSSRVSPRVMSRA